MTASWHAQQRMAEMEVESADVAAVLDSPEVTYPSQRQHGAGRLISLGGRLAVVHNGQGVVITVLWRGQLTSDRSAPPPWAA